MTAAPHRIDTRPAWRALSFSPMAVTEFALVLVLLVTAIGVGAAYSRGAGQDAGRRSAAAVQIGALASAVGAYALENSGYTGMTPAALEEAYGLRLNSAMARTLTITGASTSSYCIQVRNDNWYAGQRGPAASVVTSQAPVC